jgi:hypothetical protein
MDGPHVTVTTKYGALDVSIGAGPTSAPGSAHVNDGGWPSSAHAFDRKPDAPSLYAYVRSEDGQLTINGIPYVVSYARFAYADRTYPSGPTLALDWREEHGGGFPLKRSDVLFGGDATDGARKAWNDTISPAIVAALSVADAEMREARTIAAEKFAASCSETATRLRAEADRLDTLSAEAFAAYSALVQAAPMV